MQNIIIMYVRTYVFGHQIVLLPGANTSVTSLHTGRRKEFQMFCLSKLVSISQILLMFVLILQTTYPPLIADDDSIQCILLCSVIVTVHFAVMCELIALLLVVFGLWLVFSALISILLEVKRRTLNILCD